MSRAIDADALRERLQSLAYDDWNQGVTTSFADACHEIIDVVEDQPTIEPERKTGEWMPTEPDAPCFYRCDHCGRLLDFPECFCPTCGTDMRSEHEDR